MVWRMASADLVQTKGFGSSLWAFECGDGGLQFVHAAMDAALDLLVGEQREPALHLVEPGSAGGREMQVIARVSSEPGSDWWCLVGGVIVEHQVDVEIGWHGLFDRGQEPAEFDCAVALVATADDPAGGDVKSGEQRGRAVALVVMTAAFDLSRSHWQQRLRAVERLNLRLFINAQDQGMGGRVEVQSDDVAHLVDKHRIARQLEGFKAVRLQPEGAPDASDARGRDAAVPRHAARTPMRGIRWLTLQRLHDDALDFAVVDLARDARSRLVEQPAEAVLDKTLAPFAHGLRCHLLARRHRLVA